MTALCRFHTLNEKGQKKDPLHPTPSMFLHRVISADSTTCLVDKFTGFNNLMKLLQMRKENYNGNLIH